MANVKIKFVRAYEVQDEHAGTAEATVYKEGYSGSFEPASARHFVARGVAVYVTAADAAKAES